MEIDENFWNLKAGTVVYKEIVQAYSPEITAAISSSSVRITNPANTTIGVNITYDDGVNYTLGLPDKATEPSVLYTDNTNKLRWVKPNEIDTAQVIANNAATATDGVTSTTTDTGYLIKYKDNNAVKYGGLIRRGTNGNFYVVEGESNPAALAFNDFGNLHVDTIYANTVNSLVSNTVDSINVKDSSMILAEGNTTDTNNIALYMQHAANKYSGLVKEKSSGYFKLVDLSTLPSLTTTFTPAQYANLALSNLLAHGYVRYHNSNGYYTELTTATGQTVNTKFVFPPVYGAAGQVLMTDGAGNLAWASVDLSQINADLNTLKIQVGNNTSGTSLTDRTTALETTNAAQTTSINGLTTRVSAAETSIGNNTTSINTNTSNIASLTSRVGTAESNITTNTSNISSLTTRVGTAESNITTNTSNISGLTTRVTTAETNIGANTTNIASNTSNITSLTTRVNTAETNIGANTTNIASNTSNISSLTTRVGTAESNITTNTSNITGLTTRVGTAETNINTNTANITALTTRVGTAESNITTNTSNIATNTSNITSLTTRVDTAESNITASTGNITALTSRVTTLESSSSNSTELTSLSNRITLATVKVGSGAGVTNPGSESISIGSNAGNSNIGARAIAIGANAAPSNGAAESVCINATSNSINPTNAGTYIAPIRQNTTTTNSAFMLVQDTNNEVMINPFVVQNNTINDSALSIIKDDSSGAQFRIMGATDTNERLLIGYDTINDRGCIQAIRQGVGATPLVLNAAGGSVTIGTTADSGHRLRVAGSAGVDSLTVTGTSTLAAVSATSLTVSSASVRLGLSAGGNQVGSGVAIGNAAGSSSQGLQSVAIGRSAGSSQGSDSIAIGAFSGNSSQGDNAIAIGFQAGNTGQGRSSIAIGSGAGHTNQSMNSIVLNASGSNLNASNAGFYVNPIRLDNTQNTNIATYNTTSRELTYNTAFSLSNLVSTLQRTPQLILHAPLTRGLSNQDYSAVKIYTNQVNFIHPSVTYTNVNSGTDSSLPYQTQMFVPFNGTLLFTIKGWRCGAATRSGYAGYKISRNSTIIHDRFQSSSIVDCNYFINQFIVPNLQANDVVQFMVSENATNTINNNNVSTSNELCGGLMVYMIPSTFS